MADIVLSLSGRGWDEPSRGDLEAVSGSFLEKHSCTIETKGGKTTLHFEVEEISKEDVKELNLLLKRGKVESYKI